MSDDRSQHPLFKADHDRPNSSRKETKTFLRKWEWVNLLKAIQVKSEEQGFNLGCH